MYYAILVLGLLITLGAIAHFVYLSINREFGFLQITKLAGTFLLGMLLLVMTLPSLKSMLLKDYDEFQGECRIEITSTSRHPEAAFSMLDIEEQFYFSDVPELDAYGKAVPYYCEVIVSKDHLYGIEYRIFDAVSRELLEESD